MSDATNTHGKSCACVSRDARECADLRYGRYYDDVEHSDEPGMRYECECVCHAGWEDDDEPVETPTC